ncbi:MAG: hypothetical protein Q4B72_03340 [Lachnospiraceae bacterium]|nr:hypothetical protein [Lachnospiraceae bacterium]
MEQPAYTKVKVNNEIEFCEVKNMEMKDKVEKALLKERVSYFIRWKKPGFFSNDRKEKCVFHVNSQQLDAAHKAMEQSGVKARLLVKVKEEQK